MILFIIYEQDEIIKQWVGYSNISATSSDVLRSLNIIDDAVNDDSDVSLPKWAKEYLGELAVKNMISIQDLKVALSYLYENLK